MNYLYSIGGIVAILYGAYYLLRSSRADKALAELKRKDRSEELVAIALAQKELENAKINYSKSRAEYDALSGEGSDSKLFDE
jgi:predicted nucleic acid-binding protein